MGLLELLVFIGIAYGAWYLFRKKKNREISKWPSTMNIEPDPDPSNSNVISRVKTIEKRMEIIEARTKKVEQSVKGHYGWLWGIVIGSLLGWYWDDIVHFITFLFSGAH